MEKYTALSANGAKLPIWAVAENYRFEPALLEVKCGTCEETLASNENNFRFQTFWGKTFAIEMHII